MTDSPFLPNGRQWAWDSTSLGVAKECPRKYYYWQILNYRSREGGPHLTFGLHYAKALERFHRERAVGKNFLFAQRQTVYMLLQDTASWQSEHPSKNRETLLRSVIWYLEEFREDPCKTVILDSGQPAVELSFQLQITEDITLCGHLDRLVEYAGGHYVQDQKTTGSTLGSYYFNRYSPDNQMSLYSLGAKTTWKTPIAGVMIDAAQIAVGFTRFERGFTHRTEAQLNEWLNATIYHIKTIWNAADNGYPMNDKACQLYGGCPFLQVCSKSPQVRKDYLEGNFVKEEWNPLEVR